LSDVVPVFSFDLNHINLVKFGARTGNYERLENAIVTMLTDRGMGTKNVLGGNSGSLTRLKRISFGTSTGQTDNTPFSRLESFDIVFLIDDTSSMGTPADAKANADANLVPLGTARDQPPLLRRWDILEQGVCHLVDLATHFDSNGIDILFLKNGDLNSYEVDDPDIILNKLEMVEPLLDTTKCSGGTFFFPSLHQILEPRLKTFRDFVEDITKNPRLAYPKHLNLIVFTDGAADDEEDVEEYLIKVAKELKALGALSSWIGIQFVQVGDDPEATKWLQILDDNLTRENDRSVRDVSVPVCSKC
jgi:hypothetical protein